MSNSTSFRATSQPIAIFAGELDFQKRIGGWDKARLEQFLAVKEHALDMWGGDDFAVRALRFEIACR